MTGPPRINVAEPGRVGARVLLDRLRQLQDDPADVAGQVFRTVDRVAAEAEPGVVRALDRAWRAGRDAVDVGLVERALAQRNTGAAQAAFDPALSAVRVALEGNGTPAVALQLSALAEDDEAEAGLAALLLALGLRAGAETRGLFIDVTVTGEPLSPPTLDARFTREAQRIATELITQLDADARTALRGAIRDGLAAGVTPRELARRLRSFLGQTGPAMAAIEKLRAELLAAKPGTLVERFPPQPGIRDRAGFRVRIPAGGLSAAQLERRVQQFARMHRNLRARTVARSTAMRAANAGLRGSWLQAMSRGEIPAGVRRMWLTARDASVRPDHAAMEGATVRVTESFNAPDGTTEPGQAPNCRCTMRLVAPEGVS